LSKNEGKKLEEQWKNSCAKYDTYLLRLIDSNKFNSGDKSNLATRFTPENKFDVLMQSFPFVWSLELKSSNGRALSFNGSTPTVKEKGKTFDIKPHQVSGLLEASTSDGNIAGLLLNYREEAKSRETFSNELFFIEINDFIRFAQNCGKRSISRSDAKCIGISIPMKKLRTNYTYNINSFIQLTSEYYMLNHNWNTDKVKQTKEVISYLHDYVNSNKD